MLATHQWLSPTNNGVPSLQTPPLVYWLIVLSYKIFGVTAMSARLPVAIAMIASIALTFLIGERLAGYWRGFAAGLIHLCSWCLRSVGRHAEPVFSAFIAGAIFCAICGYQRRQFRRAWFAGFWFCASLAPEQKVGGLFISGVCVLAIFCPKLACVSLSPALDLLLVFIDRGSQVHLGAKHFPDFFRDRSTGPDSGLPRWQFLVLHFAWWFPALSWCCRIVFRDAQNYPAA
jgi:4-amino-4-deoxy-L-arabinose transferase-like glycosyltransferase